MSPLMGKEKFAGKKANVITQAVYTDTEFSFFSSGRTPPRA